MKIEGSHCLFFEYLTPYDDIGLAKDECSKNEMCVGMVKEFPNIDDTSVYIFKPCLLATYQNIALYKYKQIPYQLFKKAENSGKCVY